MNKLRWLLGQRHELSVDGIGLLKYISPKNFYHVHSDEMTSLQRRKYRALKKLKGKVRFA